VPAQIIFMLVSFLEMRRMIIYKNLLMYLGDDHEQ
jgi:hypothetical protein